MAMNGISSASSRRARFCPLRPYPQMITWSCRDIVRAAICASRSAGEVGAARFVLEQGVGLDGALPVNTSGGSLSEAYLHGMNLILEAVRQLRGESPNQKRDANVALVTGCDVTPNGALLLRRGT